MIMSVCETARSVVDFDAEDFTNSSILEFLNQEKQCLDNDNGSEVDIESIFEEINRLSGDADERNVEDILREAEMLINKQELGELEVKHVSKQNKKFILNYTNLSVDNTASAINAIAITDTLEAKTVSAIYF